MSHICAPEGQTHVDTVVGSKAESNRRENPAFNHATRPVLLIVDDEPLGLKSMASVFEGQGYELVLAGSGHEAMQFVETGRPDVILLDVMMPGMDGAGSLPANPVASGNGRDSDPAGDGPGRPAVTSGGAGIRS